VEQETQYVAQQATGGMVQSLAPTGAQWEVVIIKAGKSKTGDYFPVETLQAAVPLFEGAAAFALSQAQHVKDSMQKPVKDIVGWYDNVRIVGNEVVARLNLFQTADWLRLNLLDLEKNKQLGVLGISVDLDGYAKVQEVAGEKVRYWNKFTSVNGGGDIVWDPAAGGGFKKALAAVGAQTQTEEEDPMKEKLLKLLQTRRPEAYAKIDVKTVTEDELMKLIEEAVPAQTQQTATQQAGAVKPEDVQKLLQADARVRLTTALMDSKLPLPTQAKIRKMYEGQIFEDAALQQTIALEREYLGQLTETGKVSGLGDDIHIEVEGEAERVQASFTKMIFADNPKLLRHLSEEEFPKSDAPAFRSLRQAYTRLTGDSTVSGRIDPSRQRLQQTISSATFPNLLANSMYRRLLADYREQDFGERRIITVGSAPDFRTRDNIRIGYFGDLSTADPETGDYTEIAAVADEKVSYAVGQKGNILTITRKTIINDDLRGVQKLVGRLGRAARRTFARFVWNFFMNNATYDVDSVAWFHANHGNLKSQGLAAAEIADAILKLLNQTEPGSGEKIGINGIGGGAAAMGLLLAVPTALWDTARKENSRQYLDNNFTPNPVQFVFGERGENIIVNPLFTDTNDWGVFRDPADVESIHIDFLNGQEEPELFLQDVPTVGQMFVADKLQYKIRHEYGGDVTDVRGAVKAVV